MYLSMIERSPCISNTQISTKTTRVYGEWELEAKYYNENWFEFRFETPITSIRMYIFIKQKLKNEREEEERRSLFDVATIFFFFTFNFFLWFLSLSFNSIHSKLHRFVFAVVKVVVDVAIHSTDASRVGTALMNYPFCKDHIRDRLQIKSVKKKYMKRKMYSVFHRHFLFLFSFNNIFILSFFL